MHYIDLFSGAGGLSEGFIKAGFKPVAHVELNEHASLTSRTRMVYHYLRQHKKLSEYRRYLLGEISREQLYSLVPSELHESVINKEISYDTLNEITDTIDRSMKMQCVSNVDIIIGGPPCQAYSLVGRARDPQSKQNDPRNHLYKLYVEFLKRYQPRLFVFENVPGLFSAGKGQYLQDLTESVNAAGYTLVPKILDASNYGVLQKRKRVIIVGWRTGEHIHYPDIDLEPQNYEVGQLLDDLPALEPGEFIMHGPYKTSPTPYLLKSGIRGKHDILTQHITRPHNDRDREIYRVAINAWESEQRRISYAELPEHLRTHKNVKTFLDRYKVVGRNQPYSHTVVAHIAKDGHYYIHPDKQQIRSLSVREAARLQSFPDNFYFEGPRTAAFTQIGNAVPPILAEHIAWAIRTQLEAVSPGLLVQGV